MSLLEQDTSTRIVHSAYNFLMTNVMKRYWNKLLTDLELFLMHHDYFVTLYIVYISFLCFWTVMSEK